MNQFWALAARDWPPAYPAHQLVAAIGAAALAALIGGGVLHETALLPHATVSCATCHRDARVLYDAGGAFAVCTSPDECPDEELGPAPARVVMDADDFLRRLAEKLGLDRPAAPDGVIVPLGQRRIGEELVAVDMCTHPNRSGLSQVLARVARRGPEVRIVLVPDARTLPASVPTEIGNVELIWAGLNEILLLEGGLNVDLRPILSRRAFKGAGPDLRSDEPFNGLLLDEAGASWRGKLLFTANRAQPLVLLRLLGDRPGEFVTRRALWRALFPGDHNKSGRILPGRNPDRFDSGLRTLLTEVREVLDAAGLPGAVLNKPGKPDAGGYRLELRPDQVRLA